MLPLLSAGHAKLDVTDAAGPLNDLIDRLGAHGIAPIGRLPLGTAARPTWSAGTWARSSSGRWGPTTPTPS